MNKILCFLGATAVFAGGCSDDSATTTGGGGSTSTTSATTATSTVTGSGSGTTTSATTGTTTAASTTSSGGGLSNIQPSIKSGQFGVNCMPIVGADPINGNFIADYANGGTGDGTIDVTHVDLLMSHNGNQMTWTFDVDPTNSGNVPAMQATSTMHTKVLDSGMGTPNILNPCSFCGGKWTLEVTWAGGLTDSLDLGLIGCAM